MRAQQICDPLTKGDQQRSVKHFRIFKKKKTVLLRDHAGSTGKLVMRLETSPSDVVPSWWHAEELHSLSEACTAVEFTSWDLPPEAEGAYK